MFTVALSGFVALINLAIPPARTTPTYSNEVPLSLTCGDPRFVLTPSSSIKDKDKCIFLNKDLTISSVEAKDCGYLCPNSVVEYPPKLLTKLKKVKLLQTINSTLYHVCKIQNSKDDFPLAQKCFRKNLNKSRSFENMPRSFKIHNLVLPLTLINRTRLKIPVVNFTMSHQEMKGFECVSGSIPKNISIPVINILEDSAEPPKQGTYVTCHFHCRTTLPHNKTCEARPARIEHNVAVSFWLFVAANVLTKFLIALTYTLFEVAVVAILKEYGYDYGLQRIYGAIGGMVFAPLSGFIIDYFGKGGHYTDY